MAPVILHTEKPRAVAAAKLQTKHAPMVRLPQSTADLVNRMLAARCGGNR